MTFFHILTIIEAFDGPSVFLQDHRVSDLQRAEDLHGDEQQTL